MSAEDWFRRGVEHGIRGSIDEEIKCYVKALEFNPKFTKAWKNLGSAFMLKGDFKKGLRALKIAAKLDPGDFNTWMDMGRMKYTSRDYRGAIEAFRKAADTRPKYGKPWHWLGLTYLDLGVKEEANRALSEAARLYRESGDYESALEVESKASTIVQKNQ